MGAPRAQALAKALTVRALATLMGFVAVVVAPTTLLAASEQVPIGPRAIGMGGAFTAVADDATALFWNPAGLSSVRAPELFGSNAELFGAGINDRVASAVFPLSRGQAIGVQTYGSGFDDSELRFSELLVTAGYSVKLWDLIALGASGKYISRDTDLDGATVRRGKGLGLDLGAQLFSPLEGLRFGVVAQDALNTRVDFTEGGAGFEIHRNLRGAAAYSFRSLGTLGFDMDDRWHLGVELTPIPLAAIRGGYQRDRQGLDGAVLSFGVGIRKSLWADSEIRADYALESHPVLGETNYFGVTFGFTFNPVAAHIDSLRVPERMFLSLRRHYAERNLGEVAVRASNMTNRPLKATLSAVFQGDTTIRSDLNLSLEPKARGRVILVEPNYHGALVKPDEDRLVPVDVRLVYAVGNRTKESRQTGEVHVYGRGVVDWAQGIRQAAAFMTPDDVALKPLGDLVRGVENDLDEGPFGSPNVLRTAAAMDVVAAANVHYDPDPLRRYGGGAIDLVSYPRETLARRRGDCDDTSILMASLLANLAVPSRLVDTGDHLFLLVDTGLREPSAPVLGVPSEMLAVADGHVWLPLETTRPELGFAGSWELGAQQYREWSAAGRIREVVDLGAASSEYPSDAPEGPAQTLPAIDPGTVRAAVLRDAGRVESWRRQLEASAGIEKEAPAWTPSQRLRVARLHWETRDFDGARHELDTLASPASVAVANDLGVVEMAGGNWDIAAAHFERAHSLDLRDGGILLNLGLSYAMLGRESAARHELGAGIRRVGGLKTALRLIGLSAEEGTAPSLPTHAARTLVGLYRATLVTGIPPSGAGYWRF